MSRANRGAAWEAKLDHQHRKYRDAGVAVVFHAHPGIKGGVRQKAPPDYFGAIDDPGGTSGIPVLFEAKTHNGGRFPLNKLERHQALALEAWKDRAGVAGVALRLVTSAEARTFWVAWEMLGPRWWAWHEKEGGAPASINLKWLEENAVDLDGGTDWLVAIL